MQKKNSIVQKNGKILELWMSGHLIIEGKEFEDVLGNGCYLMYPWVNRLSDKNVQHKFHDSNGYPLHGLYVNTEREILEENQNQICLIPKDREQQQSHFQEIYTFIKDNQISIEFNISNNQDLEYGIGYHPYFNFENIDDVIMITNLTQRLVVNQDLIPIGDQLQWEDVNLSEISLKNQEFDNCFKNNEDKLFIKLISSKYTLLIESDSMKYCQIYTPSDRKRIAIEPQSSTADCFKYQTSLKGNCKVGFTVTIILN
ncbi:unnamed protein product [Paramecium pentaurelia]|uniref:Aldose 1-epimerase n=1 Tax=Paramecium pentaurelia TaxID=43138 RepID=A0A8S1XT62_9CILI|nr:unnamed protein product [Paramecium pentaurelia]